MKSFTIATLSPKPHPSAKRYISEPILVQPSQVSIANGLYDTITDLIVLAPKRFDLEIHVLARPLSGGFKTISPFDEAKYFLGLLPVTPMFNWMGTEVYEEHGLSVPILSRSDDNLVYCFVTCDLRDGIPDQITFKIGVESA